jgi:hypothetical protein
MTWTAPSLLDRWLATLPSSEGSRAVAESYLRAFPAERNAETLRRLLSASIASNGAVVAAELGDPLDLLRRQVRADFAAGEVVQVRGWVLSRSEARLAALRSLAD